MNEDLKLVFKVNSIEQIATASEKGGRVIRMNSYRLYDKNQGCMVDHPESTITNTQDGTLEFMTFDPDQVESFKLNDVYAVKMEKL